MMKMLQPFPSIAVLLLNPDCHLTCRFCASDAKFLVPSFAECLQIAGQLKEQGCKNLVLGGGEPLLWPNNLSQLCHELRARGLFLQMGSSLFPDDSPDIHALELDRWVIPLESSKSELHDRLRPCKGISHFGLIQKHLSRFVEDGVELTFSTVVSKKNHAELPGILNHLLQWENKGMRIHAWHLYRFVPEGRGSRHEKEFTIRAREFQAACKSILPGRKTFPIYRRPQMFRSKKVCFIWKSHEGFRILKNSRTSFYSVRDRASR